MGKTLQPGGAQISLRDRREPSLSPSIWQVPAPWAVDLTEGRIMVSGLQGHVGRAAVGRVRAGKRDLRAPAYG